jgi:hypothetical protein
MTMLVTIARMVIDALDCQMNFGPKFANAMVSTQAVVQKPSSRVFLSEFAAQSLELLLRSFMCLTPLS